jgi:uncharacterized protein (TIGR02246 family)
MISPGSPDSGEVRDLHAALVDRWNQRDARGFAALLAEDAHVIGFDGSEMDGPAEVESVLGTIFRDHPTASYVAIVRDVRRLGDDVAMLRAVVGMVPPGKDDLNPAVNSVQTMVASRRDGHWRIVLFQNTPAAYHGRPALAEALTEELREAYRSARAEAGG